jgi:hypothetical protein
MHEQRAAALRLLGQDAGGDAVHLHRQLGLRLGLVDGGVSGSVDDDLRICFSNDF